MKSSFYKCLMLLNGLMLTASLAVAADDKPVELQTHKFRVLGLFSPERIDAFREVMKEMPEVMVVDVDFETSEGTFKFEPKAAFGAVNEYSKFVERFNAKLSGMTRSVFGIRATSDIPRDKLKFIEIGVVGLDCPGCCLAAYESINKLEGVEQATASFKNGLVTAWIDPAKTDRAALEAALKKKNVQLVMPETPPTETK